MQWCAGARLGRGMWLITVPCYDAWCGISIQVWGMFEVILALSYCPSSGFNFSCLAFLLVEQLWWYSRLMRLSLFHDGHHIRLTAACKGLSARVFACCTASIPQLLLQFPHFKTYHYTWPNEHICCKLVQSRVAQSGHRGGFMPGFATFMCLCASRVLSIVF